MSNTVQTTESTQPSASGKPIVCFGYVNPGVVFVVDRYPEANTGAYVSEKRPFIGADCAMAAQTLAKWNVPVHLIGNALGDDAKGHTTLRRLRELGIQTHIAQRPGLHTPDEVDISDRVGTRTFFVENNPSVWESLLETDLSPIDGASALYVDWYVGPAAQRAVDYAQARRVPVYLNVEYSLHAPEAFATLLAGAAYAQVPVDDSRPETDLPADLARAIRARGPALALITRGRHGAWVDDGRGSLQIPALDITVQDTQGAGATFAAAALYGLRQGWDTAKVARFATGSASLKCAQLGLLNQPVAALLDRLELA